MKVATVFRTLLLGVALFVAPATYADVSISPGVINYSYDAQITKARAALRLANKALSDALARSKDLLAKAKATTDQAKQVAYLTESVALLQNIAKLRREVALLEASLKALGIAKEVYENQVAAAKQEAERMQEERLAAEQAQLKAETDVALANAEPAKDPLGPTPPEETQTRQYVEAFLLSVEEDAASWRDANNAIGLVSAVQTMWGRYSSLATLVESQDFLRVVQAFPPDQVADLERWAKIDVESAELDIASSLVKTAAKSMVKEYFKVNSNDGLVNEALVNSLIDTGFNMARLDLTGQVFDQGTAIIEEYVAVRAANADALQLAVSGSKLYAGLMDIGIEGNQQMVVDYVRSATAISADLQESSEAWSVDTGRRIAIASQLLLLKLDQSSGRSEQGSRATLSSLINDFEATPISWLDQITWRTEDYSDFAQGVAFELGIRGWTAP